MPETTNRASAGGPVCDALRFLCEASYAVLPREVAHQLGDFQKNFWGGVSWLAEKRIGWVEECVRGGDRLREEWRRPREAPHTGYEGSENI